jgi:hypothetical protein
MAWLGAFLVLFNASAVLVERALYAFGNRRRRRIEQRYEPLVRRCVEGDSEALRRLRASPRRHQLYIARLVVAPLYVHRDPRQLARTREIFEAMSWIDTADDLLGSHRWWKRVIAIRALGILQIRSRAGALVAALDDSHPDVRAAALDAVADLRDPSTLGAIVVRLHDESLHRGRRFAVIAAFGVSCEPFVLDMAGVDATNRLDYARALRICGTRQSVSILTRWTGDADADVRAAAFEALGNIGLDIDTAALAMAALEREDVKVRAMAAFALRGCRSGDVAARLAQHLDDQWPVAVRAAKALKDIGATGVTALHAASSRSDLAGELARQTLWEISAQC